MQRVANFGDRFCFSRVVAITRAPNQPIPRANSTNNFGAIRSERHHSINLGRQTYTPSSIVSNLSRCTLVRSSARRARSNQRKAGNNRNPQESVIATSKHRPPILNHLCFLCLFVANTFFQ